MIVPGGGLTGAIALGTVLAGLHHARARAVAPLTRRVSEGLDEAHKVNRLKFFGNYAPLADRRPFAVFLAPRLCQGAQSCRRPCLRNAGASQ